MSIPVNFSYPRSPNVELFDYFGSANVATGITAILVSARINVQLKRGFITVFGHGIDDPTYFVNSVFKIKVNGIPQRYYDNIQDQISPFGEPREIAPILLQPGDLIELEATNNGALTKLYAARVRGFFDYAYAEK